MSKGGSKNTKLVIYLKTYVSINNLTTKYLQKPHKRLCVLACTKGKLMLTSHHFNVTFSYFHQQFDFLHMLNKYGCINVRQHFIVSDEN